MFSDDTADSDWSPSVAEEAPGKQTRKTIGARAAKRGPYKRSINSINIKDKKERKKLQNVEAARRYRDKKKNEQSTIESEESILEKKNKALQEKVSDIESEIKTLKKLMVELGLIKVEWIREPNVFARREYSLNLIALMSILFIEISKVRIRKPTHPINWFLDLDQVTEDHRRYKFQGSIWIVQSFLLWPILVKFSKRNTMARSLFLAKYLVTWKWR